MKRRRVALTITDHAVLRYLERACGIDVDRVREHLAGRAMPAAELGAIAVAFDRIKLQLIDRQAPAEGGAAHVVATTALEGNMQTTRWAGRDR